ncbi:MAG TPA: NAD(P)H-dependent oxidoreductase [Prolixibacteraceae bacterium]|nr:NAD(P)H-dependent oxidoreductase [Prolixibacteraceae bacterium]
MKITIVDGSPHKVTDNYFTSNLASALIDKGHHVSLFKAKNMKINYCTGCWSCWWKSPGICMHTDDMPQLYGSYISSDLVIHYSPIIAGFVSSVLKTVNDRSIPLVHPYMALVNGECHHCSRYKKYPLLGLIIDSENADSDDLELTKDLYARFALNLKSELKYFETTKKPMEELCNEISSI